MELSMRLPQIMLPIREARRCRNSRSVPFGILGLETAIGLTLEKLVHPGQNLSDEDD